MSIMITPPENDRFEALLSSYMTEAEDDGFSDAMVKLAALRGNNSMKNGRLMRLRTGFLMGGCFMGGIISATQFMPAWALLENFALPSGPILTASLLITFTFAVWTSLDIKDAGTL